MRKVCESFPVPEIGMYLSDSRELFSAKDAIEHNLEAIGSDLIEEHQWLRPSTNSRQSEP